MFLCQNDIQEGQNDEQYDLLDLTSEKSLQSDQNANEEYENDLKPNETILNLLHQYNQEKNEQANSFNQQFQLQNVIENQQQQNIKQIKQLYNTNSPENIKEKDKNYFNLAFEEFKMDSNVQEKLQLFQNIQSPNQRIQLLSIQKEKLQEKKEFSQFEQNSSNPNNMNKKLYQEFEINNKCIDINDIENERRLKKEIKQLQKQKIQLEDLNIKAQQKLLIKQKEQNEVKNNFIDNSQEKQNDQNEKNNLSNHQTQQTQQESKESEQLKREYSYQNKEQSYNNNQQLLENEELQRIQLEIWDNPQIDNIKEFLITPVPFGKILQCSIKRDKTGLKFLYPKYHLMLSNGFKYLMSAKKMPFNKTSYYSLSLGMSNFKRNHQDYLGKVRSNFLGTEFVVYDNGINPKKSQGQGFQSLRKQLSIIVYESNLMGQKGPRRMKILIPELKNEAEAYEFKPIKKEEGMIQQFKQGETQKIRFLFNKQPRWNEENNAYVLNFDGRVDKPSVKNFQIIEYEEENEEEEIILLQFGRVQKSIFSLDIVHPFSPLQAFGIALTSFDYKLACE